MQSPLFQTTLASVRRPVPRRSGQLTPSIDHHHMQQMHQELGAGSSVPRSVDVGRRVRSSSPKCHMVVYAEVIQSDEEDSGVERTFSNVDVGCLGGKETPSAVVGFDLI